MLKIYIVFTSALILLLSGCGNLNSIYRPLNTDKGSGALIDIKQRAILTGKRDGKMVVCAEPSPDALSSYLASVSASKGDTKLSSEFSESADFIGLRTQSIQLLRDSYFRLCEAYLNGAIEKNDYDIILRRYQQNTIALLAIESLTGTVKAPQTSSFKSNLSRELLSLSAKIQKLEQKSPDEKASAELKTKKKNYEDILQILKSQAANTSAPAQNPVTNTELISAVKDLTKEVLNTDYYGQLCWSLLKDKKTVATPELKKACSRFFTLKNKSMSMDINQIKQLRNQIKALQIKQMNSPTEADLAHSNKQIKVLEQKIIALKKNTEINIKAFKGNYLNNSY